MSLNRNLSAWEGSYSFLLDRDFALVLAHFRISFEHDLGNRESLSLSSAALITRYQCWYLFGLLGGHTYLSIQARKAVVISSKVFPLLSSTMLATATRMWASVHTDSEQTLSSSSSKSGSSPRTSSNQSFSSSFGVGARFGFFGAGFFLFFGFSGAGGANSTEGALFCVVSTDVGVDGEVVFLGLPRPGRILSNGGCRRGSLPSIRRDLLFSFG